jgi:hypothetical protein
MTMAKRNDNSYTAALCEDVTSIDGISEDIAKGDLYFNQMIELSENVQQKLDSLKAELDIQKQCCQDAQLRNTSGTSDLQTLLIQWDASKRVFAITDSINYLYDNIDRSVQRSGFKNFDDMKRRVDLAKKTRSFMVMHGNRADQTQATHAFPDYLIKSMIMNPKYSFEMVNKIAEWGGSTENLRMASTDVNKTHSEMEREMRNVSVPSQITHKAMMRAILVAEKVNKAKELDDLTKMKMIGRYVKFECLERDTGENTSIGQRVTDKYDMRKQRIRQSNMINALIKPTTPLIMKNNGKPSKRSPIVQSGELLLKKDGNPKRNSSAVINKSVLITDEGYVNQTSEACRASYVDDSDKNADRVRVKGYERKDGTPVRDHWRVMPTEKTTKVASPPECKPRTTVPGKTFVEGYVKLDGTIVDPYYKTSTYKTQSTSSNVSSGSSKSTLATQKSTPSSSDKTFVKDFTKKDGTLVHGHYRPSSYNTASTSTSSNSSNTASSRSSSANSTVSVNSYSRKDGTPVAGHTRSMPSTSSGGKGGSGKSSGGGGRRAGGGGRKK